jgi:hypothetical protein
VLNKLLAQKAEPGSEIVLGFLGIAAMGWVLM